MNTYPWCLSLSSSKHKMIYFKVKWTSHLTIQSERQELFHIPSLIFISRVATLLLFAYPSPFCLAHRIRWGSKGSVLHTTLVMLQNSILVRRCLVGVHYLSVSLLELLRDLLRTLPHAAESVSRWYQSMEKEILIPVLKRLSDTGVFLLFTRTSPSPYWFAVATNECKDTRTGSIHLLTIVLTVIRLRRKLCILIIPVARILSEKSLDTMIESKSALAQWRKFLKISQFNNALRELKYATLVLVHSVRTNRYSAASQG